MASILGFKDGMRKATPIILEPIMAVEVETNEEKMGDVMGDLSSRRGRIMGSETKGKNAVVHAMCPLAEIQRYAPDLRSMTSGKGIFTMNFSSYETVPGNLVEKIRKESPFRTDEADG